MRTESVYVIPCICGHQIETHQPQTTCPKCGRLIEVQEWAKK